MIIHVSCSAVSQCLLSERQAQVYIRTHEEHEQIVDAFDEIRNHLQIIEAVGANSRQCLHGANVKLLAQILNVLGVIVRLRRNNYGGTSRIAYLAACSNIRIQVDFYKD